MTHKQQADELLERPPATLRPALTRLAAYYGGLAVLFAVVTWVLSGLPAPGLEPDIQPLEGQGALASAADLWSRLGRLAPGWLHAGLYMLASVLLVFPLVFVYLRTRTRAKFDHSLLQTVIVLPLAVTAVLMMVRNSLALAFSLAGVVAAIRFRNDLKESRDAVYIFTAIAIGFAAGIRELGVALILSMLFCALELALWRLDLVEEYEASLRRLLTGERAAHQPAQRAGLLVEAMRHAWASEAAAGGRVVAAPAEPGGPPDAPGAAEPKLLHRFRITVGNADAARPDVEAVLEAETKRWTFVARDVHGDGTGTLVYDLRLRKRTGPDALAAELRGRAATQVRSVEWDERQLVPEAP